MKRPIAAVIVFLLSASTAGCCAAPGSAMGYLKLTGRVVNPQAEKEPLRVKIVLPKEYGLGGLDRYFGQPEDYGHKDLVVYQELDPQGSFSVSHENVYHISCFIFPPIGPIPRKPPAPANLIAFSNVKDEVYLVGFKGDNPSYKVFSASRRSEMPKEDAFWKVTAGKVEDAEFDGHKGLLISLTFERTKLEF